MLHVGKTSSLRAGITGLFEQQAVCREPLSLLKISRLRRSTGNGLIEHGHRQIE